MTDTPHIPHTDCPCRACAPQEPRRQTVLLVEDDPDLALALTEAFTQAGHTVHREETMRGAMDALYAETFDCVIADGWFPSHHAWQPPQVWGLDLLRLARRAKVRGVLHSGDLALVTQAQREGFQAFTKPASTVDLLKAVEGP